MMQIKSLIGREILDSRGYPTIEVDLELIAANHPEWVGWGRSSVPSGASTGEGEALELRDQDPNRFLGKGVKKAIQNLNQKVAPALLGSRIESQAHLDQLLCDLDGSERKSNLGANTILGVSIAFLKAMASFEKQSSVDWIAGLFKSPRQRLPVPLMNILNGGKHANNDLAIQEFLIIPAGFPTFSEALRAGVEIFHHLRSILHQKGLATSVGDEGGFAPVFEGRSPHQQALSCIMEAIRKARYQPGQNIFLGLDVAASEFCIGSNRYTFEGKHHSSEEMIDIYQQWMKEFPIISIEDGLAEHDWAGWKAMTKSLGNRCQLVGDDLFVTQSSYLKKGIEQKAANSILIKLNQVGSVSETFATLKMAQQAGFSMIASHRSGETEDAFLADFAVGTDCGQIKTGSGSRSDRMAKYNQLLRIEEKQGDHAEYAGLKVFDLFL